MQSFTREHLWVEKMSGGTMRIGVSDVLARELGELEELILPQVGDAFMLGEGISELVGRDARFDIYSPVEGVVYDVNEGLFNSLDDLTNDPLDVWLVEMEDISEVDELLSESDYFDSLL